jgi:hypothetical protein
MGLGICDAMPRVGIVGIVIWLVQYKEGACFSPCKT